MLIPNVDFSHENHHAETNSKRTMDNLKSALRFPHQHPHALPPPPPPPTVPPLSSRFSAETVVARSPPGARTIQRFFSSSTNPSIQSPPDSPRFSPAFATRPKHSPSASESYIFVSSPRLYDPEVAPWARASFDEAEVLRSPTMASKGKEWAREVSGASSGGAIGVGKDKLAGAAKEVMERLARKRQGSGHGRKGSKETSLSGEESPSPRRAITPSNDATILASPTDRKQQLSSHEGREGGGGKGFVTCNRKLVDLPPRSDSRNAIIKAPDISHQTRHPLSGPGSVAHTKPPKSTLRPNSPPSISIPPLNPQPRLQIRAPPLHVDDVLPPFKALVISTPSSKNLRSHDSLNLLVQIDVGGSLHTTTLETIRNESRGGKLTQFVEGALERARVAEQDQGEQAKPKHLRLPSLTDDDDSGSSIIINPSHFEISPNPSPFPFMRHSTSANDDEDCSSPIDPQAPQLFLSMPSFAPPPPPLRLDLDPHPSSRQVKVIASPIVGSRHLSVHPTIFSNSPPLSSPTTPVVGAISSRRPSVVAHSPRSVSYHDLPPSPNELAARKALAERLRFSTGSFESQSHSDSGGRRGGGGGGTKPFESALEPFFEVLRNQAFETIPSPHSTASSATTRESVQGPSNLQADELPVDAEYCAPEVDRSRSTTLGVPRGSIKRSQDVKEKLIPRLPEVRIDLEFSSQSSSTTTTSGRPPSLTTSESTAQTDTESEYPSSESISPPHRTTPAPPPPRLCIFLDRTDITLPSGLGTTYSTIFAFLRDRVLPPFLSLPPPPSDGTSPHIDPTTFSVLSVQPSLAFGQLAALRTVEKEAKWLGIDELVRVCRVERDKWVEALRVVESERECGRGRGSGNKDEGGQGAGTRKKIMRARQLDGWI